VGNLLIEVKIGVTSLRGIRTGLLQLAYSLAKHPESQGFLVLPDVAVTKDRLLNEWHLASSVLRPDVLNRIGLCIGNDDHWTGIPKDPGPEAQRIISETVASERPRSGLRLARADYSFMVVELVIH